MSRLRSVLSLIATMAIGGALLLAVTQRPLDSPGSDPGGSQSTGTVVSRPSGPVADTTAAYLPTCTDPLTHLTTFDRASVRVAELARCLPIQLHVAVRLRTCHPWHVRHQVRMQ